VLDASRLSTQFDFTKAAVLVIDRSQVSLDVASQILAGFGFRQVQRCITVEAARTATAARAFDLILIDAFAFGQDGLKLLTHLRADRTGGHADTPIILTTHRTQAKNVAKGREAGADFVIAKPFSPAVLIDRILWVAQGESKRIPQVELVPASRATGGELELF
jgi:DNA-binding response OmpR family regulator